MNLPTIPTRRAAFLDVEVTPLNRGELLEAVRHAVEHQSQLIILGHNLHSVYLAHTNASFGRVYRCAQVVLADGMPVLAAVALADLAAGRRPPGVSRRLGSTDWVGEAGRLDCMRRVALLGARTYSNQAAAEVLQHPSRQVEILGIPADPWSESSLPETIETLRDFSPQMLLVGMGMPLQERVLTEVARQTSIPVIAAVGGALDQISGVQSLAPRWLGRMGLEWAWRLASDPRRLAGRYIREPLQLAGLLLRRPG